MNTPTRIPATTWRERGEADPHGTRYDCPVEQTIGGHFGDDALANHVYMDGLDDDPMGPALPPILDRDLKRSLGRERRLMMAKDRIRWLSRRVHALEQDNANLRRRLASVEGCK